MTRTFDPKTDLGLLPREPGVYIMRNRNEEVLYVGKATDLRSRVTSYFRGGDPRPFVQRLDSEVAWIEVMVTASPKDALLLENNLIKKLGPRYNIRLRDDKNYLWLRLDLEQPFPRLDFVRKRKRDKATYLGPYLSSITIKSYVSFLNRTLGLRTCSDANFNNRSRPCLQFQMGRCLGPCVFRYLEPGAREEQTREYRRRFELAMELLSRRDRGILATLEKEMRRAAGEERFEDAARYRDLLKGLGEIWMPQQVVGEESLSADVVGIFDGDAGQVLQILHVRNGQILGSFQQVQAGPHPAPEEALSSFILQFYELHPMPGELVLPLADEALELLALGLDEGREGGARVRLTNPKRGMKRTFLDMAVKNAEIAWTRWQMSSKSAESAMDQLRSVLGLPSTLALVECFDISSFQAGDGVGSMSVAVDGRLDSSRYRVFHIREEAPDDFSMMREVVSRHLARLGAQHEPRLLVIDGGRGHLAAVLPLVEAHPGPVKLAAIAKARPELGLPEDRIFQVGSDRPVDLRLDSPGFLLLARLRDEAHRFGVKHHRIRRRTRTLSSGLTKVPGIGKQRRIQLLKTFGSVAGLRGKTPEEISSRAGIPLEVARKLTSYLLGDDN